MSFNPLKTFKRHRIARALVGLLVLAGTAFAEYTLAHIQRPVDLKDIGDFSPATIRLGQELIIGRPEVDSEEGILFLHDGGTNEAVDISFEGASLGGESRELIESSESGPPATATRIDYQPKIEQSSAAGERCSTQVKLSTFSKMPDEIHILQVGGPGLNSYRHLAMSTKGARLVSTLVTTPPRDLEQAPGCKYKLRVGAWSKDWTTTPVTIDMAEDSALRLYFRSLTPDSRPWGVEGILHFDLGPPRKSTDQPSFLAHSVSIKSRDLGNPRTLLSAKSTSTKTGDLLTIQDLKIGSDQIQLNISGTGWVEIDGEPQTVNFVKRLEDNKILGALLTAANFALLGWLSRMVFKTSSKPAPTQAP